MTLTAVFCSYSGNCVACRGSQVCFRKCCLGAVATAFGKEFTALEAGKSLLILKLFCTVLFYTQNILIVFVLDVLHLGPVFPTGFTDNLHHQDGITTSDFLELVCDRFCSFLWTEFLLSFSSLLLKMMQFCWLHQEVASSSH